MSAKQPEFEVACQRCGFHECACAPVKPTVGGLFSLPYCAKCASRDTMRVEVARARQTCTKCGWSITDTELALMGFKGTS